MPLRSVVVVVVVLASCHGRYDDPIYVPTVGTQVPARVPLDVAWRTELYIFPHNGFFGGGGPLGVIGDARAVDPTRCVPRVTGRAGYVGGYPVLVVAGLEEGACDIEFRYTHPTRGDAMTVRYSFVFVHEGPLPQAEVGGALPGPPFLVDVPAGILTRTPAGPLRSDEPLVAARCDAGSDWPRPGLFHCYLPESFGNGQLRYASPRYQEMFGTRSDVGFVLCIRHDDHAHIVGMRAMTNRFIAAAELGDLASWGELGRDCVP